MVVNHFMAYRIMSTNMFSNNNRNFNNADKVMGLISSGQSLLAKIPVVGSLLEIPLQLMEKYRGIKTNFLNLKLTDNITNSNFTSESEIIEFMSYAI